MMIKSGYQEGLYYQSGSPAPTDALEEQLRLLRKNHGVGILGGSYAPGYPLCMASELTIHMLGYSSAAEFEEATGNRMASLICGDYSPEDFGALEGACELFLRGKTDLLWVRLLKQDALLPDGTRLWLASVCDMDALYQKELQVSRITMEKERQKLVQQVKLAQANRRLEHQKAALELALAQSRQSNEVISAIGMSEEFQQVAFEPFSQEGRQEARTLYEGSGLGLSIVKALVEQMHGQMNFSSAEGTGTAFHVTLPFTVDPAPPVAADNAADSIDLTGVQILLAEDNELNMEIAQFFIEQHGDTVLPAQDGKEAIERFAASAPGEIDLILMDVMMPVMNGYEATRITREMPRPDAKAIPILAMSANAFQDDVQKNRAAGMNAHLPKPLSTENLLEAIARYITQK